MKLTKTEIKNIIKEEIEKLLLEMFEQTPLPEEDQAVSPIQVLQEYEELLRWLSRERHENEKLHGDDYFRQSGTKSQADKVLGMLQTLAGEIDPIDHSSYNRGEEQNGY
tara:strand:+ start:308 stop:634 length:327 start_codon:yes stop_codon:yes gene_type:complete